MPVIQGLCLIFQVAEERYDHTEKPQPHSGSVLRIRTQLLIRDVPAIDVTNMTVNIQGYLYMYWDDQRLHGHSRDDAFFDGLWDDENRVKEVWRPDFRFVNAGGADEFTLEPGDCYPDFERCIMVGIWYFNGPIRNEMDLRGYPFDIDDIDILISSMHLERYGSTDSHLVLAYEDYGDDTILFMPGFLPNNGGFLQWELTELRTEREQLGKQAGWSEYYKLNFKLRVRRRPEAVIVKIVFPLVLASVMTFACFQWDFSEHVIDRLNFVATMFLAISAFLWLIDAETPRTPYLKCLDKLTVLAFAATIFIAIETIAVKQLSIWGLPETVAEPIDAGLGAIMCCMMLWGFYHILWNSSAEWRKLNGMPKADVNKLVEAQKRYSKVDVAEDLAEKKYQ